jgi:hypothetical protein
MSTRKSPAQSATLYAIGTKKIGLDGNQWIITETKNGVKRWKMHRNKTYRKTETKKQSAEKVSKDKASKDKSSLGSTKKLGRAKRYEIFDNGSRPFAVYVSSRLVSIYLLSEDGEENQLMSFEHPKKVWIGQDIVEPKFNGNSILVRTTNTEYVFIGDHIYSFQLASPDEKVKKYISVVGNSGVPYPYLLTNKNIYFMIDDCYASLKYYDDDDLHGDPYELHYDRSGNYNKKNKDRDYQTHKIPHKRILQKRI